MPKIIAMIPARLGSQRVSKKNLRLIDGKPLIAYSVETAKACPLIDEIYINSEAEIFARIADEYGVKFYKRPEVLASDTTNNDQFALDFIQNIKGDVLLQILPTSPLISAREITAFLDDMNKGEYDTMVSVVNHQIAALCDGKPINFSLTEPHKSSQNMMPIQTYATVLMAWKYNIFLKNINELGCTYHGGKGKIGYFPLSGLSTIDVDCEDDFLLVEVALKYQQEQEMDKPLYY